ncbi:UNVERIFIED_CONTAM: hypothetical protein HDU68_002546 [Siphonaria sp. JEL0065]|nr:hypothetical protein HDU68_002546 [Siphonaria sp. JEL0065]
MLQTWRSGTASYLITLLLGITGLTAWNAWITAVPLFQRRLAGSDFETTFEAWISLVFSLANLAALTFVLFVKTEPLFRLKFGLFLHGLVFVLVLGLLQFELGPSFFFGLVLVLVALSAMAAALQAAAFAVLALYRAPSICSQAISSGQGVAGLAVSILAAANTVSKLDNDEAMFVIASLLAIASFVGLNALPSTVGYVPISQNDGDEAEQEVEEEQVVGSSPDSIDRVKILSGVWEYGLAIVWDFTVTLAVFPALTASVKSVRDSNENTSRLFKDLFAPAMFIVFNLGDLIGKLMPGFNAFKLPGKRVTLYFSLARVVFIPLLLCCNVPKPSLFPTLFGDAEFMFFVLTLGISNGWIASDILIQGPLTVREEYGVEAQGIVADGLVFMLTLGLALGGAASIFFV